MSRKKPSLAQQLAAKSRSRSDWKFSAAAKRDIEEVVALNKSGTSWIAANTLAKALREKYSMQQSARTIVNRLKDTYPNIWG